MRLAILLFASIAVSGAHAGNHESQQVVPSLAQARSIEVQISGVKENGMYAELPPVLVEIAGASRWLDIWVEAHRVTGGEFARGVKLKSRIVRQRGSKRIIEVPGIDHLRAEEGVWTIRVLTGSGLDLRSLAQVTVEVTHRPQVEALAPPVETDLKRESEPGF